MSPGCAWLCPQLLTSRSALYNVLIILLHRPFVTDGHLYSTSRAISVSSFKSCATAADNIVDLVRAYDRAFSVRKAPYLISYATYVAATIHARIAAKRGADSHAHSHLVACLAIFRGNQETNWAVRRANGVVQNLMKRLGLEVPDLEMTNASTSNSADTVSSQSIEQEESLQTPDIDGIIESFMREQENAQMLQAGQPNPNRTQSTEMAPTAPMQQPYGPPPGAQEAYTDDRNGMQMQEYPYGAPQGQYPQPQQMEGGPMTVDDLLYGLNGSALDNYAFLDWEPM